MRRRKHTAPVAPEDPDPAVPGRRWFGLYTGQGTFAGPESSLLVIGPPRSGKTSSIVVPCVLDAPAAVVATSTKPDVLAAAVYRRWALGTVYVFDPTGTTFVPPGAHRLRWSPVTGCGHWERAVSTAHSLAAAARPQASLSEAAHWVERAEALLAPLLFAAERCGRDMATVCRWVLSRDLREPLAVIGTAGHEMARATLTGVAATEDRERSGIFSTAAGLLSAYRSEAALATTVEPNFDARRFASSTDAVFVCAPADAQEQLAPIVVTLLDQIRTAVYARPYGAAPVVFALDEVANIAPLPSLPAMAAEGAGQGLITLACLQDLSQARARWGDKADGFFSLFNHKLVFPGVADHRTLQLIAALAGEVQVPVRSVTRSTGSLLFKDTPAPSVTTSVTWRPRMPVDEVARGRPDHALRIGAQSMHYVETIPWWHHPTWSAIAHSLGPRFTETVRPGEGLPPETLLPSS
jgi:type IV secretory pathway TraG/TraD family ATPase VirD4